MSDRSLAAGLFAIASAPGWFAYSVGMGGFSLPWLICLTAAGAGASGAAGALATPTLASAVRSNVSAWSVAMLGAMVSALGLLLACVIFVVGVTCIKADAWSWRLPLETVFYIVALFLSLLVTALPLLALGGIAGVAFQRVRHPDTAV